MIRKYKKIWIPALVCFVLILGVVAFFVIRSQSKRVDVYPVSECSMTDYWGDSTETYGEVTTDQMQTVYVSESQQVTEVFVKEGQRVKAGDKLLAYDTTLTELQLNRKELEIRRAELDLSNAKKELASLAVQAHNAVQLSASPFALPVACLPETGASGGLHVSLMTNEASGEAVTTYQKIGGTGSKDDPYLYVIAGDIPLNQAFVQEALAGAQEAWVVFQQRENNLPDGKVRAAWGVRFATDEAGQYTFAFFDASNYVYQEPPETTTPAPTTPTQPVTQPATRPPQTTTPAEAVDPGPTPQELAKMRAEKQREIRDLDLKIRQLNVEYEQMKAEKDSGIVVSKLDGEVLSVTEPKLAYQNNEPVVKVSGGGGYYVNGSVSELQLDALQIGQSVSISAWESGTACEGEIQSVSTNPVSDGGAAGNGNYNVSYYGFTVYISGDVDLKEHEYVSITYSADAQTSDHIYLEAPFVLSENGKSYVYIRNEKGRLEKREVKTGKNLSGSYIEILGGLTVDDEIAFPYGKDLKEGRKVRQASISDLYAY